MPSASPAPRVGAVEALSALGRRIRARRKAIGVSLLHTAQCAGVSRVTLTRIERGEASVTIGAYFNVMDALDLLADQAVFLAQDGAPNRDLRSAPGETAIDLRRYPHLKMLAWHLADEAMLLEPRQVFDLVERNHRHIDLGELSAAERALLDRLAARFGRGVLLV